MHYAKLAIRVAAAFGPVACLPRARARERQSVPISELVFGALTQNRSGLELSLEFAGNATFSSGLNC